MASTLPVPVGFRTHYNGVEFDPTHTCTTGFKVTPIESTDGRTTRANRIYLRLKSHLLGVTTDAAVQFVRQRLTKYGGILIYGGRGLGPLSINTGRVKDVAFGPKPRLLSLQPLGGTSACEVEWEVDTTVPECPDATYTLGFLDLSYRVEYFIRRDGRTNRVVSGVLRIPNNRVRPGSTEVLDSADLYREKIVPPVPYWFKREWQPWRVDESRSTLTFGWTDKEFGRNVLPPGVVDGDVSQRIKQEHQGAQTASLACTLSGWFVVADGYDSTVAQNAFWRIVQQLVFDRKGRFRGREPRDGGPAGPVSFIASDFEAFNPSLLGDEMRCEFTFSYKITNTTLKNAILHSGLWEPLGNDWREWQTSVQASALHPRGSTKITFAPQDDQIVDLCSNSPEGLKPIGGTRRTYLQDLGGIPFPPVEEATSWLAYTNFVYLEVDHGLVESRRLASSPLQKAAGPNTVEMRTPGELLGIDARRPGNPGNLPIFRVPAPNIADAWEALTGAAKKRLPGVGRGAGGTGAGAGRGKGNPPPDGGAEGKDPEKDGDNAIVRRTNPAVAVILVGEALRVGFPIPAPVITDVNGVRPVLMNRPELGEGIIQGVRTKTATGIDVWGARWKMRFVLPEVPDGVVPFPVNPAIPNPRG